MKKLITLATLAKATAQEVADQIVQHLLTQAEQAIDERDNCYYRTNKSGKVLKCAAGCLIGDDEYREDMEGNSWVGIVQDYPITEEHALLIGQFQSVHDGFGVDEWPKELQRVCKMYNLEYNPSVNGEMK